VIRPLVVLIGLPGFNPFRPIEQFGLLILDEREDTVRTKVVGWVFHIWNGLSFAAMYTLAVGRGRPLWGLGWAMLLEIATLAAYPSLFRITLSAPFILISLIGHAAAAQRLVRR
jgi:hypothetical protein